MNTAVISQLNAAIDAAYRLAQADFSTCDVGDIEELITPIRRELEQSHPSKATLSSFLNSLARSLHADPSAHTVCLQLDAAMREAGIETHWTAT